MVATDCVLSAGLPFKLMRYRLFKRTSLLILLHSHPTPVRRISSNALLIAPCLQNMSKVWVGIVVEDSWLKRMAAMEFMWVCADLIIFWVCVQLGYFHRTYNPPLSFPDTLRPSDNAPCEQAAGVRGDRESSWLRTKQGQSASSVAVVKGQPGEAIEQLERKVLLYDEFEISSYTSSFAGASTSRCHGTASLATTDLVSLCSVRQQGLSCSQVSGGTVHGHAFTPRMYYESDTIYLSQSPRVFEEFQGLGLEMAAARRVCRLCCLHARCLQRVPATYSPTAASTHPRDCARPFLLFGSCSPAAHYPWYPPDTSSRLAASPDKGPGVLTWACARASGVTEASKSEKGMVSGAYRSWIEHGLTQSSRGDGHTRAETQHISGSGSTMGAVEIGAELFSLHGSFYA